MGYHRNEIVKGTLGEASKIREEFEEFMDAVEQNAKIMELIELSDLIGAIEIYVNRKHNKTLGDLIKMSDLTSKAFLDGSRK